MAIRLQYSRSEGRLTHLQRVTCRFVPSSFRVPASRQVPRRNRLGQVEEVMGGVTSSRNSDRDWTRQALWVGAVAAMCLGTMLVGAGPAQAHRDGCHRWHSCPSDSGSYVCGDLGYYSECPGTTETVPDIVEAPPEVEYDFDPPTVPTLSKAHAGPGGVASMTILAERGSRIVVAEDQRTVAKATGTGKTQRITFKDSDGSHTYAATATDSAGNESIVSDPITIVTDGKKPFVSGLAAPSPTAATGSIPFTFNSEAGAKYTLTVPGMAPLSGTVGASTVEQVLWLRNGTYPAVLTVKDAVGNTATVRRTLKVSIAAPILAATLTSAVNQQTVRYTLKGTPRSRGTITFAGLDPVPFTVDDNGAASLTFNADDGTYPAGKVTMTDFAGRRATMAVPGFSVDTLKPALTLRSDAHRAKNGTMAVLFTAEEGSKVVLTAVATSESGAKSPVTATVTATGAEQSWTPAVPAGAYRISAAATDEAGNVAELKGSLTVADPLTPAELVVGLLLLLLFVGGIVSAALLAWFNRHRIQAWQRRRREAAAALAHQRAVAAAQNGYNAALAAHRDAMATYHRNDAAWTTRAQHLDHLVDLAKNARGQTIPGFAHIKLKAGERVYTTTSASLVEERTQSGVPVIVETCTGTLVVTNTRVVFDGPKNRQWLFDQLQRTDVGPTGLTGSVIMTVTSRKSRSGVRPMGTPAEVEEAHALLLAAIGDTTGQRAALVAQVDGRRDAHRRSRPQPPPAPPVPALLRPAHTAPNVAVCG